jgi:hypothetical protein
MAQSRNNVSRTFPGASRPEFRVTREGVSPTSISSFGKLILDAATRAALTHAGAKLVVEIDAGGTRVLLADQRTGQIIGGPDDLQRLGSIRTFVNRERKDALGIEAAKETTQLAYLAEQVCKVDTPDFVMKPVDTGFAAQLRPFHGILKILDENTKILDANTSQSGKQDYEPHARRLIVGIGNAYTEVIAVLTGGGDIKGLLRERLFANCVPDWAHGKFTTKLNNFGRTEEWHKLFFPQDPMKGLALTMKEWRDDDFVVAQGLLTSASTLINQLVSDDELVYSLTKIKETISLKDESNLLVEKLLRVKLNALPVVENPDHLIDFGGRSRAGFKFPTPSMDTPSGAMIALSTAVLRIYSANLQSVDLVSDYFATIVPGEIKPLEISPTNNVYVQWGNAKLYKNVWEKVIKGGLDDMSLRADVWRWIRTELRLSEKGKAGVSLANALLLEEDGSVPEKGTTHGIINNDDASRDALALDPPSLPGEVVLPTNKMLGLLRPLSETEIIHWKDFQLRVFPPSGGRKKVPVGLALTPLTTPGRHLVNRVKLISPYVAERMLSWLRSFSDERLQLAAVKVTNAEFDNLFSSLQTEEVDDAQSEDWADDGAPI